MSDSSRRTPPHGSKKVPSRPQSQAESQDPQEDRDTEGYLARRARENAPAKDATWEEDFTDRYEGEELEAMRATRTELVRIHRLEKKHDELKKDTEKRHDELKKDTDKRHDELKKDVADVKGDVKSLSNQLGDIRSNVSGALGKLEGQEKILTETLSLVRKSAEREHVTFTAKVEVDKAQELAKVEVDKAQELAKIEVSTEGKVAEIEVSKEEKTDAVKAKDDRRKRNLKLLGLLGRILGLLTGGGVLVELLHRIGVL